MPLILTNPTGTAQPCTGCSSRPTLGRLGALELPAMLKDWRVLAALAAVALLLMYMRRGSQKNKRKKLIMARLQYQERRAQALQGK